MSPIRPKVSTILVAAVADNGVIGQGGGLPLQVEHLGVQSRHVLEGKAGRPQLRLHRLRHKEVFQIRTFRAACGRLD